MRLAWLINLYPAVTHTFIRREIEAIEDLGHSVLRVSHRRSAESLPAPQDRLELQQTRVLLEPGGASMLWSIVVAARRPLRFGRALWTACRFGIGSQRGLIAHVGYFVEACILRRWLDRDRIEHLHAHFGGNSAMVALLCRMLGGPPYSFTVHGPQEFDDPDRIHLDEKVSRCAMCVAVSDFTAGRLRQHRRPHDGDHIHVVRCGVDSTFLEARSEPPPIEPRFLFIGRLDAQKNPGAIIEAIGRLHELGHHAELTMIGAGPLRPQLEKLISALDLTSSIHLLGACNSSRVLSELATARALVLPSAAEGLPVVIMEAFAAGRPVIASDVGGVPELVNHGVNGWLVSSRSVDDLVEAMLDSLRRSPTELHEMALRGRELVRTHYDARRNAHALISLIESVHLRS